MVGARLGSAVVRKNWLVNQRGAPKFVAQIALIGLGHILRAQNDRLAPLLREFSWRAIGPATLGGRVDDIEAVESNPHIVYVGVAEGSVWKSENAGTTWVPVFDGQPSQSIGDIAVSRSNPNIVWVGTGEANTRQSTTYGAGVFKSPEQDLGAHGPLRQRPHRPHRHRWSAKPLGERRSLG